MREVAGRVLIDAAREAAGNAHAPYSRFGVGAAVLLRDGQIVTGANFENASYGLSLCAETVTLATANSQGKLREVVAIAVIGGALAKDGTISGAGLVTPCGRCRQILNEAAQLSGRDIDIHCGSADGSAYAHFRASELLPHAFGPADLGIE
jgi:cytidine deaminase